MSRTSRRAVVTVIACFASTVPVLVGPPLVTRAAPADAPQANTLTQQERDAGWKLLFDGKTAAGWRGYKAEAGKMPPSWKVVDGSLVSKPAAGETLGHIVTDEQFDNFELAWEWKMAPGGNSGVMYRVTEAKESPWDTGPEYQILDNARHLDGNNPLASASACYAVYPPAKDLTKPVGEWNQSRIVADGPHVEHWLNGEKVLEYDVGTEAWQAHLKTSKYWTNPDYGRAPKGHVCIQDYGNPIEYRNIKIRPMAPAK
jgi:hypothetical protein